MHGESEILPKLSAAVLPPAAISAALTTAARTIFASKTNQAMRLRAVNAAASNASTKDHAKLVSGKLNR